jgi:dTDP-4-amino-4,6-dideoxygalactose transaminase
LPVHQEKIFREYDNPTLKNAEDALLQSLCLPIHPEITDIEADRIAAALIGEVRARL